MTADEFVKIVREGSEKLRVDDIVFGNGEREFHGKGMLRICANRIEIDITLNPGEKLPPQRSGIFTKSDCLKLRGVIEDRLQFHCEHVGPIGKTHEYHELLPTGSYDSTRRIVFRLHPIELVPTGLSALTSEERRRFYNKIEAEKFQPAIQEGDAQEAKPAESDKQIRFEALLRDYPFFPPIGGGLVKGKVAGHEFTLSKDEGTDLRVSLCSTDPEHSSSEAEDWRRFRAVMDALAFVHGMHAWPYRVEYWKEGRKVTDRVTAAEELGHTSHTPFSEALHFNAKAGKAEWDYVETIEKAAAFFETDSTLRKEVATILFLFREADDSVHSEITTLAMCALFENLVNLVFKELSLKEKLTKENDELTQFEQTRTELAEYLAHRAQQKGDASERWQKVIGTASPLTQREKFQALVDHFGLKWDGDMELIFKTWKQARNPLVHETARAERTEPQIKQWTINESRIAGAINIILLKLFGYSGSMRASVFEDKYRKI